MKKEVEEAIERFKANANYCVTSIETTKIILNYIKELEKGITRLKDKNKKLSEEIIDVKVDKVTRNFIPKQVIRDKIEELKEQFKDYDERWSKTSRDKRHPFYKYLIRIEAEIDILKELLEED